jgi:DNA helicase-2/ATP-dependent DNA helicase PcrA
MTQALRYHQFKTQLEQYAWILQEVRHLINSGQKPSQIAVISRRHAPLAELAKYFHRYQVPVYYERGQNVLEKPYIRQLLTMLKFVHSLSQKNELEADEYLPEILSYPFWELDRQDLWHLSVYAYAQTEPNAKLWLNVMQTAEEVEVSGQKLREPDKLEQIAQFFLHLATESKHQPVQYVLDRLVGVQPDGLAENEQEEGSADEEQPEEVLVTGFKQFYFDKRLDLDAHEITSESVNFLSNLRTLIQAIRQYRAKDTLFVSDVLEFVALLEKNKLPLIDNSPFGSQESGVCLLTAHKAKGLEFEIVFIVDCVQDEWFGKRSGTKLDLPLNLALLPDNDDLDDQLRLFYVAVTRAKHRVYFTTYTHKDDQKEVSPIAILTEGLAQQNSASVLNEPKEQSPDQIYQDLLAWQKAQQTLDLRDEEKRLLSSILENYRLSVTHLNNFLDVTAGGPRKFLEQNLLHFPQGKSPAAAYGTAMHAAIGWFLEQAKTEHLPSPEVLIEKYQNFLRSERLSEKDLAEYLELGAHNLRFYHDYKKDKIDPQAKLEFSFAGQEVTLDQARLTGQIDLLEFGGDGRITVTDFKTGKPLRKWQDSQNQVKLWRYQNQLIFYKILVEHSRNFGSKFLVERGQLEFVDCHKLTSPEVVCLPKTIGPDEAQELEKLVKIVFYKIMNLDFPDTSQYSQDFKGVQQFVEDLLNEGTV